MPNDLFLIRHANTLHLQSGDTTRPIAGDAASLDWLLANVRAADLLSVLEGSAGDPVPLPDPPQPPVEHQEVWAAGVTYQISAEARERESGNSNIYLNVYDAPRPELFLKAFGPDVVGPGDGAGIRADSTWDVPEPELTLVLNSHMEVIGLTIGNDMSSRSIEGANPLYLPQAKMYQSSCVLGPRIWLNPGITTWPDLAIHVRIDRGGKLMFEGETGTAKMHRTLPDLIDHLGRAKQFPLGAFLLTGTGVVPPDTFTLESGDLVSIHIDPIGALVNPVIRVGRKS